MRAVRIFAQAMLLGSMVQAAETREKPMTLQELRDKAQRLERDLREAVPRPETRSERLAELRQEAHHASRVFQEALDTHSAMEPLSMRLRECAVEMGKAISAKDEAAKKKITAEIAELTQKRDEIVAEVKALRDLRDIALKAHRAYVAQTQQVFSELPESKEIYAELLDVRAQIKQATSSETHQ